LHKSRMGVMAPAQHRFCAYPSATTLEDSDRALIVETLERAGWIVGGPRGAAAKLGLKRTTLLAKMRRLGDLPTHPGRKRPGRSGSRRHTTGSSSLNNRVVDLRFLP
jgi:DNA-binding NtrC family response regulator